MGYPTIYSGSNVYVPSLEASGNLVINYSRNVKRFPIAKWAALKEVNRDTGYWAESRPDENTRVTSPQEYIWPSGSQKKDDADWNNLAYTLNLFKTERYKVPFAIDQKTAAQASFDVLIANAGAASTVSMTLRTLLALDVITTAANYPSGNQITPVGTWSTSTPENGYIRQTIQNALIAIKKATNSAVETSQMQLVISPVLAFLMRNSPEIVDMVRSSPFAYDYLKADGVFKKNTYGLPPAIEGVEIVVEDTVSTTSKRELTAVSNFIMGGTTACLISKVDDLVNDYVPSPSYNTVTGLFWQDEFTLEQKYDDDQRLHRGRVIQDLIYVMTAPASGAIITSIA